MTAFLILMTSHKDGLEIVDSLLKYKWFSIKQSKKNKFLQQLSSSLRRSMYWLDGIQKTHDFLINGS